MSVALLLVVPTACRRDAEPKGPRLVSRPDSGRVAYRLAVHPLHNPAKLFEAYQPLVGYLNQHLGEEAQLTLEASRDYGKFEEKYAARGPEFLLPNPWQTLQAMKRGYHVLAMAGDPEDFKGLFVVRQDSGLTRPAELKGRAVSYPSPTALAACIMPQYFLFRHGLRVGVDLESRYVGSQESAIMNAYLGTTAVGATWPPPWRAFQKEHPREAAALQVLWETESLVNNSVMARDDVPPRVVGRIRELLLGLDETDAGRAILAGTETRRFLPATDADYEVVREYVARFEAEVRLVEQP